MESESTVKKQKITVRDLTKIALLTALMAVTAWITIPIPPISSATERAPASLSRPAMSRTSFARGVNASDA